MKKIFRDLLEILKPTPQVQTTPPENMFGLGDAEILSLAELRATEEWPIFLKVLDCQSTLYGEAMLASVSVEKMWEMRGYILGLRRAGILVDEILQKQKESKTEDERRRSQQFRANDHRATALYGTASWANAGRT